MQTVCIRLPLADVSTFSSFLRSPSYCFENPRSSKKRLVSGQQLHQKLMQLKYKNMDRRVFELKMQGDKLSSGVITEQKLPLLEPSGNYD